MLKNLPGSTLSLSLRPVSLATDLRLIYGWISQGHSAGSPAVDQPLRQLKQAYSSIISSDFAQPFMGLVNNVPICQLDIYKTRLDVISLYYGALPGDYGLHLLSAPQTKRDQEAELLGACIRHFFSFPEIGRIIMDVEAGDKWMNAQIKKLGFHWHKKINKPYKIANLYTCTRKNFKGLPSI